VPEAINLWADHPQTAVHVVSLAEDDLARETLRLISLAGKGKMVEASELLQSEPALEAFVQDVLLDILPEEPPEPSMHHVVTLLFESRSSRVGPAAAAALEGNAAALRVGQDPIIVDGHSDGAGSEEENQIVSEQRAEAVKSLLVEKGISVERVRCVAYGKLRPVASNETPDGRSKNRRVEIKVLRQ
jgi:outer membrane protein OmpA-like peptidoglycan-associated protein